MRSFGLVGWSGSGKTTLMTLLIPSWSPAASRIDAKAPHIIPSMSISREKTLGAPPSWGGEVMITSQNRWALMHELRGAPETFADELVAG